MSYWSISLKGETSIARKSRLQLTPFMMGAVFLLVNYIERRILIGRKIHVDDSRHSWWDSTPNTFLLRNTGGVNSQPQCRQISSVSSSPPPKHKQAAPDMSLLHYTSGIRGRIQPYPRSQALSDTRSVPRTTTEEVQSRPTLPSTILQEQAYVQGDRVS